MNLKNAMAILVGGALLTVVGAGCTGTKVQFADVPGDRLDLARGRQITSHATGFQLLFIPLGLNSRQERAYAQLKKQARGDYITDIKIQETWRYAVLGTTYRTTFSAMAYPDKSTSPAPVTQTLTGKLKELKDLLDKKQLTSEEYEVARKKLLEQFAK